MIQKTKSLFFGRLGKFFYGGIINYVLKIGITVLLTEFFEMWYLLSYIVSLFIVIIFSFWYNAYITYEIKRNKAKSII